MRSENMKILYK